MENNLITTIISPDRLEQAIITHNCVSNMLALHKGTTLEKPLRELFFELDLSLRASKCTENLYVKKLKTGYWHALGQHL